MKTISELVSLKNFRIETEADRAENERQMLKAIKLNRLALIQQIALITGAQAIKRNNAYFDLNFNPVEPAQFRKIIEIDDNFNDVLFLLSEYLYGESDYPKNIDPQKSLLLIGNIGVGKTTILRTLMKLQKFYILNATDITDVAMHGENFNTYNYGYNRPVNKKDIAVDDLGTEPIRVMSYGNELAVMASFVSHRYNLWINRKIKTHITTNLSMHEIEDRYGLRVYDRLMEMCEIIVMTGESKRR